MSWEHVYYEATCRQCGAKGFKVVSSDDWGRSETSWEGFSPFRDFPRHDYLVARKRIDENEYARCKCGSINIDVESKPVKWR